MDISNNTKYSAQPNNSSSLISSNIRCQPALFPELNQEPDLIQRFLQDVEEGGLVGEKDNAATVFLCAVSARLRKPLNLTVQGPSSGGKNHLLGKVASFIPEDRKRFLTGMTSKVLMHANEDEFEHKALFIAEYEGVAKADYAIRTFQSEQVIEWEYVETSNKGIKKKKMTVRGPAAFIQATTRPVLHPENETRLLFIQIDESAELTREIMCRQAQEAAEGAGQTPTGVIQSWHELINGLELTSVVIPFAPQLATYMPADQVRSRRDFPKLLGLIEASAFLHQHVRETHGEKVIAIPQDYKIAKRLFEHAYSAGPNKAVADLLKVAESLQATKECFRVADLMERTGSGKSWTYEVLKRAEELGCVAEEEQRGSYRFLRHRVAAPLELPEDLSTQ